MRGTVVLLVLLCVLILVLFAGWTARQTFEHGEPGKRWMALLTRPSRYTHYRRSDAPRRSLATITGQALPMNFWTFMLQFVSPWSSGLPTDKNMARAHSYVAFYEDKLASFRERNIQLLEIGVYRGGSLVMWREFFSEDSKIYGLDVAAEVPRFDADPNITVVIGDSRHPTADTLQDLEFDIIIDDGCHHHDAQFQTARNFFPKLRTGGLYVIEDVTSSFLLPHLRHEFPGQSWEEHGTLLYCEKS